MALDRLEYTAEEIAGLTDAELVELRRSLLAEIARLRPDVLEALGMGAYLIPDHDPGEFWSSWLADQVTRSESSTEQEARFMKCGGLQFLIDAEINSRMRTMLRTARLALGLSLREVGKVAGIHSKFVAQIEQGQGGSNRPDLFEKACVEGALKGVNFSLSFSLSQRIWTPLVDPRLCRTVREVTVDSVWLKANGGTALSLAQSIRDDRSFDLLPFLGDALEEAGCVDRSILEHCRDPGLHAAGCWVVDALVRAGRP